MKIKLLPFEQAKARFLLNLLVLGGIEEYKKEMNRSNTILGIPKEFWDDKHIIETRFSEPIVGIPMVKNIKNLTYPFCCCEVIEE